MKKYIQYFRNYNCMYLFFLGLNNMNFTQDILPDNYATVLPQDCPIYVINIKQNTNIFNP